MLRGRICLGLLCCGLGIGGCLLRLFQLRILGRQIGLQAVDLALEFLPQSIDLFFDGGFGWRFLAACFFAAGAGGSPA